MELFQYLYFSDKNFDIINRNDPDWSHIKMFNYESNIKILPRKLEVNFGNCIQSKMEFNIYYKYDERKKRMRFHYYEIR